jgi:hypothetical protein
MSSEDSPDAIIESDDESDTSSTSASDDADDDYSSGTSSEESDSDDSDSEFVDSEDDTPRPKPKPKRQYTKLIVEPRQTSRVHSEAAKRNMSVSALTRIIKTFIMTEGGDTEGERQNAERALGTLLRAHDLERADVASLATPMAESELLDRGAEMRCIGPNLRVGWSVTLASACSKLYSTAYYFLGDTNIVFYGEAGSASACAYLFAELHPAIMQLTDEYMARRTNSTVNPLTARASYRHGLCNEFYKLACDVSDQRKKYVERCLAESEVQLAAIAERLAELREKKRIQKLSAMRAVAETLATVDGTTESDPAAGQGSGAGTDTATAAAAPAAAAPAPDVADEKARDDEDEAKACAICWEPMKLGVAFITNPCGHTFHVECQAKAVSAKLVTCGLCRAPLTLTVFSAPANAVQSDHDPDDEYGLSDVEELDGDGEIVSASDESDDGDSSSDYEISGEDEPSDHDTAPPAAAAGADAGGNTGPAAGAAAAGADDDDDDVVFVACYTAEETADIRRAKSEMIDLTEEELHAQAQEADRKYTEAGTLATVAQRDTQLINAMEKKIFGERYRRKDGTIKKSACFNPKRVVRDLDAYQAGKNDAKRLKTGDALQH